MGAECSVPCAVNNKFSAETTEPREKDVGRAGKDGKSWFERKGSKRGHTRVMEHTDVYGSIDSEPSAPAVIKPTPVKIGALDFVSESLKTAMNPSATITPRATGTSSRPNTPRGPGERMLSTPRGDLYNDRGTPSNSRTPNTSVPSSTPFDSGGSGRAPSPRIKVAHAMPRAQTDAESLNKQTTPRSAAIPTRPLLSASYYARDTRGELPDAAFSKSITHGERIVPVLHLPEARARSSTSASSRSSARLQMDKLQFHGSEPQVDDDVEEMMRLNAKLKESETRINNLLAQSSSSSQSPRPQHYSPYGEGINTQATQQYEEWSRMKGSASWNSPPTMETSSVPRPIQTPSNVQSSAPAILGAGVQKARGVSGYKPLSNMSPRGSFNYSKSPNEGTRLLEAKEPGRFASLR